jgi:hypothetical protein
MSRSNTLPHIATRKLTKTMATQRGAGDKKGGFSLALGGFVLAIILAVVPAAVFVSSLDTRVKALENGKVIETQTGIALGKIDEAKRTAADSLKATSLGFIGPLNKLVCIEATPGCQLVSAAGPDLDLNQEIPKDRKLLGAWYVVAENMADTAAFTHLDATVIDRTTIRLHAVPRLSTGQVRVFIYAVYGPM